MADNDFKLSLTFNGRTFTYAAEGIRYFGNYLQQSWGEAVEPASEALKAYLTYVAQMLASKHSGAWPSGTTSTSLSYRTGESVKSILASVSVEGTTWDTLTGKIGGIKRLAIHEFGGVIESKGKLLAIPLPAALSGSGIEIRSPRDWQNTFVTTSKKGNLIVFQRRPGRQIVPLYVLVRRVRIPPRLGMREALNEEVPYFLSQAADRVASQVMEQLGG